MRTSAQKIIDAADAYTTRAVMGSPPSIGAQSLAFAVPTIAGVANYCNSPMVLGDDVLLRRTGPMRLLNSGNINQSWVGDWVTYDGTGNDGVLDGGDGFGWGFNTTSRYLELAYIAGTTRSASGTRMRVNDEYINWVEKTSTKLWIWYL